MVILILVMLVNYFYNYTRYLYLTSARDLVGNRYLTDILTRVLSVEKFVCVNLFCLFSSELTLAI